MNDNKPRPSDNDSLGELASDVDRDVEVWDHEVEPKIAGRVVELGSITTQYGTSPTVDILTKDGRQVRINGFGAVRRRALSQPIEPGDLLAMRFVGKTKPKSGAQAYADFRTIIRNPDGSPKGRRTASHADDVPEEMTEPPVDSEPLLGELE
jgi:hypothetical protein